MQAACCPSLNIDVKCVYNYHSCVLYYYWCTLYPFRDLFTAKFFFERLVNYMSSGEMEALVLAHPRAVERWRELMGPTKPSQAQAIAPSSVRGLHGLTDTRNSVHGSGEWIS